MVAEEMLLLRMVRWTTARAAQWSRVRRPSVELVLRAANLPRPPLRQQVRSGRGVSSARRVAWQSASDDGASEPQMQLRTIVNQLVRFPKDCSASIAACCFTTSSSLFFQGKDNSSMEHISAAQTHGTETYGKSAASDVQFPTARAKRDNTTTMRAVLWKGNQSVELAQGMWCAPHCIIR
jgi:hypothetical protein